MVAFDWSSVASAGVGAVGNIIGGLIGKKKAKNPYKQAFSAQMDAWTQGPEAMVRGAKRAGLHPLAVLGGNWSAGTPIPVADGQSGWGDAVGDGLNAVAAGFAGGAARERQQELDEEVKFQQILQNLETTRMNDAQIRLMDRQGAMYDSEVLLNGARTRTQLMDARHGELGGAPPGGRGVTLPMGMGRIREGASTTAQDVQDKYGDVVENAYGIWRLLDDVGSTVKPYVDKMLPAPLPPKRGPFNSRWSKLP